ncbi:protein of unknown function [Enterobacter cancerogenus]|nr:protein of unknown function [Enterobacter cancerogenus]
MGEGRHPGISAHNTLYTSFTSQAHPPGLPYAIIRNLGAPASGGNAILPLSTFSGITTSCGDR